MRQDKPDILAVAPPPNPPVLRRRALTVALSVTGTLAFVLLSLPLPFLFGPMSACLVAALFGAPLLGLGVISKAARTILGVAVGASITPEVLGRLPQMAASVAFIPPYIAAIALIGVPYFHKICKYDLPTAYFAAMPGGLQDMLAFGQDAGANVRALSLAHATRVLIIVTVAPLLIVKGFELPLDHPMGATASEVPLTELALMVLAALIGWKGGERIGLFGATIIGPLVLTAALSLGGFIHARPPAEAIKTAQFFIGMGIGVGYVGVTLHELRRDVLAGTVYVGILAALALLVTELVVQLGFAEPLEGFLSFAPGGQAEMTVLGIIAGADLGFIVVHHLLRVLLVVAGAPLAARMIGLKLKGPR
uniref:Aminopeptidase n=2 Tax=Alloyangia mangrovi TaxID=1779329 RepID=A0A2A3JQJ2_9RHOB